MTDRPSYTFIGRCDELAAEPLHAFDDTAREITARTARRHLGPADWLELEQRLGYVDDRGRPPNSALRLATDWAVRFELGLWCGERALNVRWSAYHHIFVRGGAIDAIATDALQYGHKGGGPRTREPDHDPSNRHRRRLRHLGRQGQDHDRR